jgi:hypothetical protein
MDDGTPPPQKPAEGRDHAPTVASEALAALLHKFPEERITVGEILDRLEGQAFGLLLLLLALPNCIPNIPGLSTIFGVLMIAPALQLIIGQDHVWLPRRIKQWSISRDALRMAINGAIPVLRRIEKFVAPRWTVFVQPPFRQLLGLQTLLMAMVLILPIPLGNWPPGMTVAATALALLQRDGRLAMLSLPMAILSVGVAWAGVRIGIAALQELGEMLQGAFSALF